MSSFTSRAADVLTKNGNGKNGNGNGNGKNGTGTGNGMRDDMSFLGLSLTLPAYVVLIAGLVLVVLQTIFMLSRAKRTKTMPHILVINVALMLVLVALNVYIINCLSVGRCDILAVIITALYLLAVVNALIYFLTHHGGFLGIRRS
jgi:hypothetical protein